MSARKVRKAKSGSKKNMRTEKFIELRASSGAWLVRAATDKVGITRLGIDTEGTGREKHNLLRQPVTLNWLQGSAPLRGWSLDKKDNGIVYHLKLDYGLLDWHIEAEGDALVFRVRLDAWTPIYDLAIFFNISQKFCPTAVLPHDVEDDTKLIPPWLFVAPDHGHLYCEVDSLYGRRMPVGKRTPLKRYSPVNWYSTLTGQRRSHTLIWALRALRPFEKGDEVVFRFSPQPIAKPEGVDDTLWERIRRPWLAQFQANADENDVETPMMLANNVLSNPAVCCTAYYSDPLLFTPEPLPGIDLPMLVRRTLDDWFANRVMIHGNVAAFGKSDTYLMTNPMLISAAWDYFTMTGDTEWLKKNMNFLQLVGAFLVRRDQDFDGLTESIHSGNAWTLRDPDRSDFYLESINFGHKNAITNAMTYRAYHCMADMLNAIGCKKSADVYEKAARKLHNAYVKTFYNKKTGVLAGWKSQDGKIHDYMFPFVNGLACAYGLVNKKRGRKMLSIIMKKLREIKPKGWRWGVPVNLIPVPDFDLRQPAFTATGEFFGVWNPDEVNIKALTDDIGLVRMVDPDGSKSYKTAFNYNGATQTMLTAYLAMGLIAMGMEEDADWVLEPMIQAAEAGELQNGLHVGPGGGAEHHDWDGNPCGYEGYLPEAWYFLLAAMMKNPVIYRRLLPFAGI